MGRAKGRSRSGVSISLFSFQDIITSLSGIMILLVLLILLDLITRQLPVMSARESKKMESKRDDHLPNVDENHPPIDLKALEIQAKDVHARHDQLLSHIVDMEKKLATLKARHDDLTSNETITLIPEKGGDQRPLFIQCSKDEIRILGWDLRASDGTGLRDINGRDPRSTGGTDHRGTDRVDPSIVGRSTEAVEDLPDRFGTTPGEIARFLETMERSVNPNREYLLMMVKPSASNYAMGLIHRIRQRNFDVGYDAMLEHQTLEVHR